MNFLKFQNLTSQVIKYNDFQTLYKINDITQLSFRDFVYSPNRNVDFERVSKIRTYLEKKYQQTGYYLTGGWIIVLGMIPNEQKLFCLDGQHRWNALEGMKASILFLVEKYENEEELYNGWCAYAAAQEVQEWLVKPIARKEELKIRMDERQYVKHISDKLTKRFPKIIRNNRNPPKPYIHHTNLSNWIQEIYNVLPDNERQNRPTKMNPEIMFDIMIKFNDIVLNHNDSNIIKLFPKMKNKIQEVKLIQSIYGFHESWVYLKKHIKDRSRKWNDFIEIIEGNRNIDILQSNSDVDDHFEDANEE